MSMIEAARCILISACREVHGMWHAGASREEGLERLQRRIPRGLVPKLIYNRGMRKQFAMAWGPEHCGPDHDIVICDDPRPV
jgi:hypothetical protein